MKTLRSAALTIALFAGMFLAIIGLNGIAAFKKPVDLYAETTEVTDISKITPIEADIYAVLDCFVQETTTTKKNGSVTSKEYDYYYIIPAYDGDDEYYIGIKVPDSLDHKYDEICDLTWDWLYGEENAFGEKTVHTEGRLKKMDKEIYQYMTEWFEEMEWFTSDADIEKYVLAVYLDPFDISATKKKTLIGGGILAVCLLVAVLTLVFEGKKSEKAQEQKYLVINGVSYPKEVFDNVNRSIENKENIFALQEFCEITGLKPEEAQAIIHSWHKFYL